MTSEVLILNKKAVVLGADSAVTTSYSGDHPRYSKSANKIFELTNRGSIAAAIYGTASIDRVPWELAIKLFRVHLQDGALPRVADYVAAVVAFLAANDRLFPQSYRYDLSLGQFDAALLEVAKFATKDVPAIVDPARTLEERKAAWAAKAVELRGWLDKLVVAPPLTQGPLDALLADLDPWVARAREQIAAEQSLEAIDPIDIAALAHLVRYKLPKVALGSGSGLVIAGYGSDQIFPAYEQLDVFGHVGNELYFEAVNKFDVTHTSSAMIQPLAKTSMIDVFTDGFGESLSNIIDTESKRTIDSIFAKLEAEGVAVPAGVAEAIGKECQEAFMTEWKRTNWRVNFHPLLSVLQSLSVQEMAHLAESLLGLESLKERVTSSSETVGGPIDVAAITKAEGLVWIRRKHYFDAALNMRYAARLNKSFD